MLVPPRQKRPRQVGGVAFVPDGGVPARPPPAALASVSPAALRPDEGVSGPHRVVTSAESSERDSDSPSQCSSHSNIRAASERGSDSDGSVVEPLPAERVEGDAGAPVAQVLDIHLAEPVLPRAAPYERADCWGPFTISKLLRQGVHVGWGATCRRHRDPGKRTQCQTTIHFRGRGDDRVLTDDECVLGLKRWLIYGFTISDAHPTPRAEHISYNPRMLALMEPDPDEDLEEDLRTFTARH